jgi:hypothetical protein
MSINTEILRLNDVRLSFAFLFSPKKFDDDSDPRYECTFLLDPENAKHKTTIDYIESEFDRIVKEEWGEMPKNFKGKPFGYADEDGKEYDGWAGMYYIQANTKPVAPKVVDRNPNIILTEQDGRPYAGCYVNGTMTMWADARPKVGPRVNSTLRAVQFLRDGEAFSGSGPIDAASEFEDISDEVEDSSFLDD